MKDTTTLLVLMLATVATGIIATVADGQDATPPIPATTADAPAVSDRAGRHAQMLARFDANQDGKLDETEREAVRAAVKSGEVPLGRMGGQHRRAAAWVAAHPEQARRIARHAVEKARRAHRAVVARYDADGDGKLDQAERSALRADIEAGNVPPRMARALRQSKQSRPHRRQGDGPRGEAPATAQEPA